MNESITVGDTITYRPCFGMGAPTKVVVDAIEMTDYSRSRSGVAVPMVPIEVVHANKAVFFLSDGHWCYSEQIILD